MFRTMLIAAAVSMVTAATQSASASLGGNGVNPNGIMPNGVNPNVIMPNGLVINGVATSAPTGVILLAIELPQATQ